LWAGLLVSSWTFFDSLSVHPPNSSTCLGSHLRRRSAWSVRSQCTLRRGRRQETRSTTNSASNANTATCHSTSTTTNKLMGSFTVRSTSKNSSLPRIHRPLCFKRQQRWKTEKMYMFFQSIEPYCHSTW